MKNPYLYLLRTAWTYARKERKRFVLIYLMFICANILFSLNPLLLGWFINKAQQDTSRIVQYALLYVGSYIGLKLLEWCLHGPARVMERTLAFRLSRNFMQEKYHQTLHLPAKWHQDHHSGATINRIRKAYDALRGFFDSGFSYLYTFTKFAFSVTAILYFSPVFGSIAILLGLMTVWVISRFDKPFIESLREVNRKEHEVSSNLFDSLSNIRTIITLRLERSMERGLLQKVHRVARPFRRNARINEWKWFTAEMMITLIYGVVIVGFIYQNWKPGEVFMVAGLVTLLGYVNQFTSVFQSVANQYTGLMQYHTHIQEAAHISDAYATEHRQDKPSAWPEDWNQMEIRKLNFSHRIGSSSSAQGLSNLRVQIERGSRIALIGPSGSGKSTLLSLLRGLYLPGQEAEFRIDGSRFPMDEVYRSVTLFPQEPEIFENTLEYNVTLGIPCRQDEIWKVCDIAGFSDVVRQLPEGLETDIREKGVNLSGGQKQRLALARGVLAARDSRLILLDEPTSSIDPVTEAAIYKNLFEAFADKAVVSSIHRLHLLDQFDYIYILDKGRIVDEGSFGHLLTHSDIFKAMWEHQKGALLQVA